MGVTILCWSGITHGSPVNLNIRVNSEQQDGIDSPKVLVDIRHHVIPPHLTTPAYALEIFNDGDMPQELEECYVKLRQETLQQNTTNPAEYGNAVCR